ncbi:MAG TPA: response regulator [Terriglobia bacterium]|nr:response regulator [Terriglobia bacterium]
MSDTGQNPLDSLPLKFMVVSHDLQVIQTIQSTLEELGSETVAYADSVEAAACVWDSTFDGFFLDAEMPHPDGFELASCVRESSPNAKAPIVIFSEVANGETMRRSFRAGATFFLRKFRLQEQVKCLYNATRGATLEERRSHQRGPLQARVECKFGDRRFESSSLNISECGILLEPSRGLEVGQEFDLVFNLPGSPEQLKSRAKVVRKEPPDRIAAEFISIGLEEKAAIRHHVLHTP